MDPSHLPLEPLRRIAAVSPMERTGDARWPAVEDQSGAIKTSSGTPGTARILFVIPAHNEADNMGAVVEELRHVAPSADVLVVDDGSTDRTADVLPTLGVAWLRLGVQLGVGGAIRTGLRYALARDYDVVVRLDGDGQHPASLIAPLVEPLLTGSADVVVGSRYATVRRPMTTPFLRRLLHYVLGRVLSIATGRLVTDGTSGFWAFNRRAVTLLADRHPSGYPEPELILMLSHTRLRFVEVPVEMRDRMNGQTSLTMRRTLNALARLILHLVVVPLRSPIGGPR